MRGIRFYSLVLGAFVVFVVPSLAGCQTRSPSAESTPTAIVNEESEADKPVGPGKTPEDHPEDSSIVIVIPEDPTAFSGIVSDTGYNQLVMELALLSLAEIDPQGKVYPELAAELPTVENGAVVVDEAAGTMDVTWKLRKDVTWADGEPLTVNDVIFTWDAITDPEGGIWAEGVDYTDSLEKLDDFTFRVHYNAIYPAYLTQFGGENFAVFAEHFCDLSQGFVNWDCNLNPLSSGPYILEDWVNGDHLTFRRNPKYFTAGKPEIETIVIKIVPEKSVEKTMLLQGDADIIMWVTEEMIVDLEGSPGVMISQSPTARWVMRLYPNLAARGSQDAESEPHPILSDKVVRRAIRAAIDVDTINREIWHGIPSSVSTEFFRPPYICDVPIPAYDPEEASATLDRAGWVDADGDGIRECQGCASGAEGAPLALELTIYSEFGNELELTQQLIAEMLKAVGFDIELSMVEGGVIWSDSASGGTEQNGNFDLDLWDDGYPGIDPTDYLRYQYHSDSAQPDNGWNVMRWKNPEFDALLEQAYTLDEATRKDLFCRMADILADELPVIPLFSIVNADAHSSRLEGIQSSTNDLVTWNAADWKLAK